MNLKDLIEEIRTFVRSLRGINAEDFVGWLALRPSIERLTARDVYFICLGRLPEQASIAARRYPSAGACAAHILECLLTKEFRTNLPELVFAVMPELRRHFFIHIPRTGGTTLRLLTETHHGLLSWNDAYAQDDWFTYHDSVHGLKSEGLMLRFLAQFGGSAPETFFYMGHVALGELLARRLIRPQDEAVAVLRDPAEMVMSTINYILTIAGGEARSPDAVEWTNWLQGLDHNWVPGTPASSDLIYTIVASERFRADYGDMITRYLSLDGTVSGAMQAIEIAHLTVIDTRMIGDYARDRLGIVAPIGRDNASHDIIGTTGGVTADLRTAIERMTARDVELVDRLRDRLGLPDLCRPAA